MKISCDTATAVAGIHVAGRADFVGYRIVEWLEPLALAGCVVVEQIERGTRLALRPEYADRWIPNADALGLSVRMKNDGEDTAADLEREIWVSMLASPYRFEYPACDELESAVRMRMNIVAAAQRTTLAFHTEAIERPADCWTYAAERGFTVKPGCSLIDSLVKATQPDVSNSIFAFSCYRATEYVILLGIAQELERTNPVLLKKLQRQWEVKSVMSGAFHETFLHEHGSLDRPVPFRYYVPGDRVWFRNPDPSSSDIAGYEGSWVFYLGAGLFSNFWKQNAPYTLARKCLEIFHWRHGIVVDANGNPAIDEEIVDRRVAESLLDAQETLTILSRMMRLRDPQGVYREGGCIDASRECPRWVRPETTDIKLPADI